MNSSLAEAQRAQQSGNHEEAEKIYKKILTETPENPEAHLGLGLIYGENGRLEDAIRSITSAITARPDYGEAWFQLCDYADRLALYDLSCFAGQHTVRLLPNVPRAFLRYGLSLSRLGKDAEAIECYQKALFLDPSLIKAAVNACVSYKNLSRYQEAEESISLALKAAGFENALDNPDQQNEDEYTYIHWHLALIELLFGRYKEGFAHYRARFKGGTNWRRFEDPRPLWKGEDLKNKRILVTLEQGYGDVLMFCRYLPLLKEKGAYVIFQTQAALAPFFRGWSGADEIIIYDNPMETFFDYHIALFDLPFLFGTTFETLPKKIPYLPTPSFDQKTSLEDRGLKKVGLVWAGEAANARDKHRSIPLQLFEDILDQKNLKFYSLTRTLRDGDKALLKKHDVIDLSERLHDFSDTAKFINQLDLVITCDTAVAHLAGGMGKKVWVLLPKAPDWRWLLEREDSPWYPTTRLFRQAQKGDWRDPLLHVKIALNEGDF